MSVTPATRHDYALVLLFFLLSLALYFLPTGFGEKVDADAVRCTGTVVSVDDSEVGHFGLIRKGEQGVTLEIRDGPFAGQRFDAHNQLLGQLDRDKLFRPGDTAYVVITVGGKGEVLYVNPQAHYRLGLEGLLLGLFVTLLVVFGGVTGLKALLSFVFTGLAIWKVLVPLLLKGVDPVWLTLGLVTLLCATIIFLVAGVNRVGLTAFFGAFLGVLTSCALAAYFTRALHVHGAVMPFAETLLYAGYSHLDLAKVYMAGVFLASSGAVMDLAMDVAASMGEVVSRNPGLSRAEAVRSGLRVGRAVVGTMTTTLLLAYSGGYVTLLMAFMAQGIPLGSTFNFIYVAAEVLKTLVGSFGLVTVAPFTAVVGGFLLAGRGTAISRG
ncbi:YibE/F family protein [Pseudodesulfovibrio sp.]|uniref:YibE/F family protein n=1 Tax=Pseudodesulfovibrio sp. TaxID=2035812 RepID=UPI002602F9C6|nr:YibE/F family protein [Pseudodesulfovibrio sp.]MDD3310644.1 YibE/F family protein [Pseudodesulfovibrio sp.]